MVRHIWLSEKNGMGKKALTAERRWLSDRFDCRQRTVDGTTAHMRIRVKDIVPGQLNLSNAQFARRWVALAGSVEESEERQAEVAEYLQVDVETIAAICDGVREEIEEIFAGNGRDPARTPVRPVEAGGTQLPEHQVRFVEAYVGHNLAQKRPLEPVYKELAQLFHVSADVIRTLVEKPKERTTASAAEPAGSELVVPHFDPVRFLKSGEHIDYATKSKEAWRQAWKKFIEDNTDALERARMRVLCLPGKRLLEIPLYIELGFRPENIVAVEGGDRIARADCELTARRYADQWGGNLDLRLATLEEVLETEKQPFDIVSLDFVGQMCAGYLNIASKIPVNEKALSLVTMWTRRWKKEMQNQRQEALDDVAILEKQQDENLQRHRELFGSIPAGTAEGELIDFPMGAVTLGADREEHWQFRQRLRRIPMMQDARALQTTHQREREEFNMSLALEPHIDKLVTLLQKHGLLHTADPRELSGACNLGRLVSTVMFDKPVINTLERWSYLSTVSDSLHEFHTDMAVMNRARSRYDAWKPVVDFLSHGAEHALELLHGKPGAKDDQTLIRFELRRNGKDVRGTGQESDDIVCLLEDRVIGHCPVSQLLQSSREFTGYLEENPHSDPSVYCRIPRMKIHY